jgi:hypothetical protein
MVELRDVSPHCTARLVQSPDELEARYLLTLFVFHSLHY